MCGVEGEGCCLDMMVDLIIGTCLMLFKGATVINTDVV